MALKYPHPPIPELREFLEPMTAGEREQFASRCVTSKGPTSRGHLQNVMYGVRSCATDLAVAIERESGMAVRRWHLRPTDWYTHWPELVGTGGAPRIPRATKAARVGELKAA